MSRRLRRTFELLACRPCMPALKRCVRQTRSHDDVVVMNRVQHQRFCGLHAVARLFLLLVIDSYVLSLGNSYVLSSVNACSVWSN